MNLIKFVYAFVFAFININALNAEWHAECFYPLKASEHMKF